MRTFENDYVGEVVSLQVNGELIEATGKHPFWVVSGNDLESRPAVNLVNDYSMTPNGRWVNAKDLQVGDVFLDYLGNAHSLDGIAIREDAVTVYNFEVAGTHTYTVSNLGVLVHNDGCWTANTVNGRKVYQRDDLFEPTPENLALMRR